ncbi:hypothetical protein VB715_04665 [Crocosphaera sp. UHCC 0190]|uniref:hypothetical protein n=1 Tax=Crocosphaera sp. UHCC 0190 TaxID=3110246 RepID=UPI002B1F9CC8|nr:hypothetical protein [Crocosphaera sp. UHCC 0190]MEA5509050.1 hypothetical protein [Crocosphaera sp. UHCC 0190]
MLPKDLCGPNQMLIDENYRDFLKNAHEKYPLLDKDFISQVCFEHPDRFNQYFPYFDINVNKILRREVVGKYLVDELRYDNGEVINMWKDQFDDFLNKNDYDYVIFKEMINNKKWPFPPIVIQYENALKLGCGFYANQKLCLFEGTHRISYFLRMIELNMIDEKDAVEILEIL